MDVPRDQTWVVEELADMIERRVRAVPAEVLLQHACARSRTLSTIIQPAAMIVASWQCLHTGHLRSQTCTQAGSCSGVSSPQSWHALQRMLLVSTDPAAQIVDLFATDRPVRFCTHPVARGRSGDACSGRDSGSSCVLVDRVGGRKQTMAPSRGQRLANSTAHPRCMVVCRSWLLALEEASECSAGVASSS